MSLNDGRDDKPSSSWPLKLWRRIYSKFSSAKAPDTEVIPLDSVSANAPHVPTSRKFLSKTTNWTENAEPLSTQQQTYLDYIWRKVSDLPGSELENLLANRDSVGPISKDEAFEMLASIADVANSTDHFGVDNAIARLVETGIFQPVHDDIVHAKARVIVYILVSWICMLYSPLKLGIPPHSLQIDENQFINLQTTRQDIEEAKHPICEVIQQFGSLLPVRSSRDEDSLILVEDTSLHVSLLNAQTLHQIGRIDIKWINNVSSHLLFDKEGKYLLMFSLPSYCHLHRHENSTFAKERINRIVSDYYDHYSKPVDFSAEGYLREIRLSYRLIFGDNKRAHDHYKHKARNRAFNLGLFDPYLDELTQDFSRARNSTDTYSVNTDFPILGPRLLALQAYINRQNPGTMTMLWRDRRDMLRWYTFWLVTIVGGVGILFALGQLIEGAMQVHYAISPRYRPK